MNKIYNVVWNRARRQLVVTSELATIGGSGSTVGGVMGLGSFGLGDTLRVAGLSLAAMFASMGFAPSADAALFINNGNADGSCTMVADDGTNHVTGSSNATGCSANSATQTSAAVFNNDGVVGSIGQTLYVNGGQLGVTDIKGGTYSMRLGSLATLNATAGTNAIAIGSAQTATANGGSTIATTASGAQSVAIGSQANSTTTNALALGTKVSAASANATAVGSSASVDANSASSIAQGNSAGVTFAQNALALGTGAKVNGATGTGNASDSSMAIGNGASVASQASNAIAQGTSSSAAGASSIALGDSAVTSATTGQISIGHGATTSSTAPTVGTADTVGIAIGSASQSTWGVAIGDQAKTSSGYGVSIGRHTSSGLRSTAIGFSATATGTGAIAIGDNFGSAASASGNAAVALNGTASQTAAVAIGSLANASAADTTAVGESTVASARYASAVGYKATAASANATAIGSNTSIDANSGASVAEGNGSKVTYAQNALAIGSGANVSGASGSMSNGSTAIGNGAAVSAGATDAIAMGSLTSAQSRESVAIGKSATAKGGKAVSIGSGNTADGDGAVALGNTSNAQGQGSVAIGYHSSTTNAGSVALGDTAGAKATNGVALGSGAVANNQNDVALGAGSTTGTANSPINGTIDGTIYTYAGTNPSSVVSVGSTGNERQITNVAAGIISSTSTDAINGSQLFSTNQAVDGVGNSVNQLGSTATTVLGGDAAYDTTNGKLTMSNVGGTGQNNVNDAISSVKTTAEMGWNVTAQGTNGTNVASSASVDLKNSDNNVVVSKDTTSNDVTFDLSKDLTADSITTGNSKLDTNGLAINDGTNSTTYASTGMTIANGPSVTTSGIDAGSLKITNVADGTLSSTSKDAVNGSQLFSTSQAVDGVGNRVNQLGSTASTVLGGNATYDTATGKFSMSNVGGTGKDNVNDAISSVDQKAGAGWNLTAQGANSTNVAPGATVDLKNSDGNVVVSKDTNSNDVTFNLGKDLTADSVTTGNTLLNTFGVQVGNDVSLGAIGLIIANGPSVTTAGIDAGSKKITNVAAGTDATDAVNLSQLTSAVAGSKSHYYSVSDGGTQGGNYNSDGAIGTNAVAAGVGAAASSNNATALGSSTQASAAGATAVGSGAVASAAGATAAGNGSQANGTDSVAMGDGAKALADGSVALGSNASDGGRGAESYTGEYSGAQNNTVGTVSVGNASTGETRTLSNVADGRQATDAVNLRQLDGVVQESKTYTDTQMTNVSTSVTNLGNQVTQNTANVSNLQNGTNGFFQVNNNGGKSKPSATGTNAAAGGAGSVASGNSSLALGTSASATADNAVALGSGSVADRAYSVSVGSVGKERQITNVAAGTAAADAVNVSQLQSSQQGSVRYDTNAKGATNYNQMTLGNGQASAGTRISNVAPASAGTDAINLNQLNQGVASANQYTDDRFNKLDRDIGSLRQDTYAGIAGALATANLPQVYSPGASMVAAGVGNYQGQSAVSVGLSTLSDNGKWILKVSGTTNSRGQTGIGAGVGYQW